MGLLFILWWIIWSTVRVLLGEGGGGYGGGGLAARVGSVGTETARERGRQA